MFKTALIISGLLALPAFAQSSTNCAGLENDVARLTCFDANAAPTEPVTPPVWESEAIKDGITDTITTTISIAANTAPDCRARRDRPKLNLICESRGWTVRITQDCSLIWEDQSSFLTRIDSNPPKEVIFTTAPDGYGIEAKGKTGKDLLLSMINTSRFQVKIAPERAYPFNLDFNIAGLEDAISTSGATCTIPE